MSDGYRSSIAEVLQNLGADPIRGLREAEAGRRLESEGPNELVERRGRGPWTIFLGQLTGTMAILLIAVVVVSFFLGDDRDAAAILAIVLLNALLGFYREYRAEKAMALTFLLQFAVVYAPFLQGIFATVSLSGRDLAACLAASALLFWGVETVKWLGRRRIIPFVPPLRG